MWGLVDDRYDVAARTPSLSPDDARRLCRVPDMGDPGAPLDDAVAYLVAPEWGPVCARYYTNAQRDSSGRLTIVYDVVRPTREMLVEAQFNPFRVFPPRCRESNDRTSWRARPPTASNAADAGRLAALLPTLDERMLSDVLAAVLTSGHVLWLTSSPLAVIEAIVLMLPVELRERFTFQSRTLNRPAHLPVLTVAEQQLGSLRDVSWSVVLPRDRASLSPAAPTHRLRSSNWPTTASGSRVHTAPPRASADRDAAPSMLAAVERMLRLDRFLAHRIDRTSRRRSSPSPMLRPMPSARRWELRSFQRSTRHNWRPRRPSSWSARRKRDGTRSARSCPSSSSARRRIPLPRRR